MIAHKMGTLNQVQRFWSKFGQPKTRVLEDGTVENYYEIRFNHLNRNLLLDWQDDMIDPIIPHDPLAIEPQYEDVIPHEPLKVNLTLGTWQSPDPPDVIAQRIHALITGKFAPHGDGVVVHGWAKEDTDARIESRKLDYLEWDLSEFIPPQHSPTGFPPDTPPQISASFAELKPEYGDQFPQDYFTPKPPRIPGVDDDNLDNPRHPL